MMIIPSSPGHLKPSEFMIIGSWMLIGLIGYLVRVSKGDMDHEQRALHILGKYR